MSSLTVNVNSNLNSQLIADTQKSLIKLLVFKIGKLTLALPILQVQKIIKHNPIHGSGLSYVNLTHLDDRDIAVVDLHQKLFNVSLEQSSQTKGYFIISKNIIGEPLGILVSEPPALIDVTATQVRLIPDSYRRSDTLKISSHVTVIPQEDGTTQTVFILDLASLI